MRSGSFSVIVFALILFNGCGSAKKVIMTNPEYTLLQRGDDYIMLHQEELFGEGLHTYQASTLSLEEFGTWQIIQDTLIISPQIIILKEKPTDILTVQDSKQRRYLMKQEYANEMSEESECQSWRIIHPSTKPIYVKREQETGRILSISR